MLAPIIIFAFNRLDVLKRTIDSLLQNKEASESELYVFVDGPRKNKEGEAEKVSLVQDYVKTITGFKSLHYTFSTTNKGLANSINHRENQNHGNNTEHNEYSDVATLGTVN